MDSVKSAGTGRYHCTLPGPDSLVNRGGPLMWLALFGIVLVMSLGFGLGSVLADVFERDSSY